MQKYNHKSIEKKWQQYWQKHKTFFAKDFAKKPKKYILAEFPYPSGEGLHMGHLRPYVAGDVYSRFLRMRGKEVVYPMGWDAFGLPAENFAIKHHVHPSVSTAKNIKNAKRQIQSWGVGFDWSREVNTTDPNYYKWTQWLFLQFYKVGLAYEATGLINWCPKDKTGLANEEVIDGKCERCGTVVEKKQLRQWYLKITAYAEKLLKGLKDLPQWPEAVKLQQENWIGKSVGAEIEFEVSGQWTVNSEQSKNALIIYGLQGHSHENWFPWLKQSLEKDSWQVSVPTLPNADHPSVDDWNKTLSKKLQENSVIVGHSLGAPAALNLIQTTGKKVDKLILVAPVNPNQDWKQLKSAFSFADWDACRKFAEIKFDWKKISELTREIIVYYSDNDKFIPKKSVDFYKKNLPNAIFKFCPGKGHFNESAGMKEFPEILEDVLVDEAVDGKSDRTVGPGIARPDAGQPMAHSIPLRATLSEVEGVAGPTQTRTIKVFTTRPDTIFGATYLVLAPENPLITDYGLRITNYGEVQAYIEQAKKKSEMDRTAEGKEKTGVELKGIKAINPATKKEIPVWIADYVLANYGTGAIMAVPAHDQRDFEFAKKFGLGICQVVVGNVGADNIRPQDGKIISSPTTDHGILINSGKFTGMKSEEALAKMAEEYGKMAIQYKLRDWVFSRQRYWGEPIPIVHCEKCGIVPVPEKDLPVKLPKLKDYEPTGTGESPLAAISKWVNVKCPVCKSPAKRETNTMPNWAGSSWYFLRYTDPKNKKEFASLKKQKYWTPVDVYFGGMEHTTLHLLYSRFWNLFLYDRRLVTSREPFNKRQPHGLILASDGEKMSKSRGNVVNPDEIVKLYGADTLRMYELFLGPHEASVTWNDQGVVGVKRFLDRVWGWANKISNFQLPISNPQVEKDLNRLTKKVTEDVENFRFNTAVSAFMEFHNKIKDQNLDLRSAQTFIKLLYPFAPHLCEEINYIWALRLRSGSSTPRSNSGSSSMKTLQFEPWPKYNPDLIKDETVEVAVQINGKFKGRISVSRGSEEAEVKKQALVLPSIKQTVVETNIKKIIFVPDRLINFVV